MDYGTDFLLVDDDIVFTSDGDIEIVSGSACVAQDIDQMLKIMPGALIWDKEAGSAMLSMLNDSANNDGAIIAELERVAINDPRVDPATVKATKVNGRFHLEFTPLASVKAETLDYDLTGGKDNA